MKFYTLIILFLTNLIVLAINTMQHSQYSPPKAIYLAPDHQVFKQSLGILESTIASSFEPLEIENAKRFVESNIENYPNPKSKFRARLAKLYFNASRKEIILSSDQREKQNKIKILRKKMDELQFSNLIYNRRLKALENTLNRNSGTHANEPRQCPVVYNANNWTHTYTEESAAHKPSPAAKTKKSPSYTIYNNKKTFDSTDPINAGTVQFSDENQSHRNRPLVVTTQDDYLPFTHYHYPQHSDQRQTPPLVSPARMSFNFLLNEEEHHPTAMNFDFPSAPQNTSVYVPSEESDLDHNVLDDEQQEEVSTDEEIYID